MDVKSAAIRIQFKKAHFITGTGKGKLSRMFKIFWTFAILHSSPPILKQKFNDIQASHAIHVGFSVVQDPSYL